MFILLWLCSANNFGLIKTGPQLEKQLHGGEGTKAGKELELTTSQPKSVEKSSWSLGKPARRQQSPADAGLARLSCNIVIRRGLSEKASELTQLGLLHDLAVLCSLTGDVVAGDDHASSDKTRVYAIPLNRHQLQVALVEISHLISALGDAAASSLYDAVLPALRKCLSHPDHGVRHEAATAYQSVAVAFPAEGRDVLSSCLGEIESNWADLVRLASQDDDSSVVESQIAKRRFRRKAAVKHTGSISTEKLLKYQYVIHGNALTVSVLLNEIAQLAGGLPAKTLDWVITTAHSLVHCQDNEILAKVRQFLLSFFNPHKNNGLFFFSLFCEVVLPFNVSSEMP